MQLSRVEWRCNWNEVEEGGFINSFVAFEINPLSSVACTVAYSKYWKLVQNLNSVITNLQSRKIPIYAIDSPTVASFLLQWKATQFTEILQSSIYGGENNFFFW